MANEVRYKQPKCSCGLRLSGAGVKVGADEKGFCPQCGRRAELVKPKAKKPEVVEE